MRLPRLSAVAAVLLTTACGSSLTEPVRISDAGPYPYRRSPAGMRMTGTNRVLMLPAAFLNGATPTITTSTLRDRYFSSANSGLATTYSLASRGMFTLRGEVAAWSQSSVSVAELGLGGGQITPSREGDYILGAIRAADGTVDFGQFDNDGPDGFPNSGDDDGLVDGGVVIVNSDRDAYCDLAAGRGPHPHTSINWRDAAGKPFNTSDARTGGGFIAVGGYVVMSALACDHQSANITTLAHELGHLLFALPDLYHSIGGVGEAWEVRRWVLGCWELMAAGSIWGCGSGAPSFSSSFTRSATFGAWTRLQNGWVDPVDAHVTVDSTYTLTPLTNGGGTVLRVPIFATEYLLVEYREPAAGDETPPAAGVLIYHIADQLMSLFPSVTGERVYKVSLIEADDDSGLLRTAAEGGDRGRAEDAFGNTQTTLDPATHSHAKSVGGVPFPFVISGITIDRVQHVARFRIAPR